jgi:photosystem II stability/assembly factor-like uncharacterized protein
MFTFLSTLCHGLAWGHAGAVVDAIDVVRPSNSAVVGLETTVGYLRQSQTDTFEWNCHEAVTHEDALITPQYVENGQGVILVTIGDIEQARQPDESLYRSDDRCNWTAPTGLTDQQVSAVAFDPKDDSVVLAVTANLNGSNSLFRSTDAGLSWTQTSVQVEDRIFRTVLFSSGSNETVWMSAVRFETDEAWIYHSNDGGLTWGENAIDVRSADGLDVFVDVLIADAFNPDTAWVVMGPWLDDRLLQTTDGGETFTEVYTPEGDIIDGAQDQDGSLWLVTTGNKVIFSETGELFARVESAPLSLGIEASQGEVFLATRIPSEGNALAISQNGTSFESIDALFMMDGTPHCPAGSHTKSFCAPLWPALRDSVFGFSDTATPPSEDPDSPTPTSTKNGRCNGDRKNANVGLLAVMIMAMCRRQSRI